MTKKVEKCPSKEEVINTLLREDPVIKKYGKLILIVEHKKISEALGYIKAELIHNGKLLGKGSMTCLPKKEEDSFDWNRLMLGQSFFDGYSLDYKEEGIMSLLKQGLVKSMKEGKIPFLPKS